MPKLSDHRKERPKDELILNFFLNCRAQQPRWPKQQDEDQNGERNSITKRLRHSDVLSVTYHERFRETDQQATQLGSLNIAETTKNRRNKCLQARDDSHQRINLRIVLCCQHSAGGCKRGA